MMKIRGFIEGFYNRKPKKNDYSFKNSNITHYIYAPKEDSYIRQKWRIKDKSLEVRCIPKNITQVYTLSPGADLIENLRKISIFCCLSLILPLIKDFPRWVYCLMILI